MIVDMGMLSSRILKRQVGRLPLLHRATSRRRNSLAAIWLAFAASAAVAPVNGQVMQTAPRRGAEQANRWMPLDAVTLPTSDARRVAMLDRIRDEIAKRRSTMAPREIDRVLTAMNQIARDMFVGKQARLSAYLPVSLDIGYEQTISDAYIVAVMTAAAKLPNGANVLDIGTGSGYQAAVLSKLAKKVTSIEIVPQLARKAKKRLHHLGYDNVSVMTGDGYLGWPPSAPFDAIIVAAGGRSVPTPLIDQLKIGGRLIIPIGSTAADEQLYMLTKVADGTIVTCSMGRAIFVPMTGQAGQAAGPKPGSDNRSVPSCYDGDVT